MVWRNSVTSSTNHDEGDTMFSILSQQLLASVKRGEGERLDAYQDSKGIWTIGYGTNLQELHISKTLAEQWLADKLMQAAMYAQGFGWWAELTPARKDVVIEMLYNLGGPRFGGFKKFIHALDTRQWDHAADEMLDSKWHREDVGKPGIQGDTDRAERLAHQMRSGEYV